jgi:plastocyanin
MSTQATHPFHDNRDVTERANRQLTLVLFAGILVLATIGITVSVMANSMMSHRSNAFYSVPATAAPEHLSLYVAPGWKPGPDGERHDAFSITNFNVKVGQQVVLKIDNRDDAVHSITSAEAGVNVVVKPGVHTYTFVVGKAGRFTWFCAYTCDPFSMAHIGYMQGYITATS